ncbi:ABC transporter substrate-binding protein [Candidatus Cryosericum odellii]|jgi:iron complex transport system substrate-binding protein|uniref:Cobalamin-binding protein n=1 Tax=Candidatus Cryosericum odellii TaxID=2290917 RepID=A0A398CXV0_9BACT|nr:cobalamin-binding protein [Candidatus Cryosericum odellii]RIE07373.1 cobalamin-binding protein [Candidatus Cryosericum odellii]
MLRRGYWNRTERYVDPTAGCRLAGRRWIISLVLAVIMVSMLVTVPATQAGSVASAASMRRVSLNIRAGQSTFVVTIGSKRVAGSFPKGSVPVELGTSLAFPMRALIEAAGGVVRFERSQNTAYFALGPVAGAYEFGSRTLVDSSYNTSVRKDLVRVSGKTGTLYLSDEILNGLVTASGGTMTSSVSNGLTSIVLQIPSAMKDVLGYEHDTFSAKAGKMRLVTLAPNLAENCFALGQGSNIIATSEYTDYPEEAKKIPTVGAFSNPSLEKLLVLSPDLILVTDGTPLAVIERLHTMGRQVYADDPKSLSGIVDAIRSLSVVLGVPDRGFEVALSMHRSIAQVAEAAKKLTRKPAVYVEIWNSPLMSAGKGTFVSDLISVAGGSNIADEANTPWPVLSEEYVISHNPDVIIVASGMGAGDVLGRAAFSTTNAVKQGHVYDILGDYILRPSPRIIKGLELIADYVQRASRP